MIKDYLIQKQRELKMSNSSFAELLGYRNRISWERVKNGYCQPSDSFLLKAKRTFPEIDIFGNHTKSVVDRRYKKRPMSQISPISAISNAISHVFQFFKGGKHDS